MVKEQYMTKSGSYETPQNHEARMKRWASEDRSELAGGRLQQLRSMLAMTSTPVSESPDLSKTPQEAPDHIRVAGDP
jgi:hypothetical protein